MKNLAQEIGYILNKGIELKKKYTDDYLFNIDYLNIFSTSAEEYEDLIEQGVAIGKIFKEREKGIIFELNSEISYLDIKVKYVQIAKPNKGKGMRGYISYTLENFEQLKEQFSKSQNIILVQKQGYLRLEVKDSNYDVMVYLASDSLIESILNPHKKSEEATTSNSEEVAERKSVDPEEIRKENSSFEIQQRLIEEKGKRMELMADFQNYQKRIEAEKATWGALSNLSLIQDILEIYDDMQMALNDEGLTLDSSKQSIKSAQEKLIHTVERAGIEKVEVKVGEEFNKEKMEAVSTIPVQEDSQKNKVIAVISSAYKYKTKDGVLKAAKVVVGK